MSDSFEDILKRELKLREKESKRTRIKLAVYADLDNIPGTFYSAESARNAITNVLQQQLPHYRPAVSIESYDISKQSASTPVEEQRQQFEE